MIWVIEATRKRYPLDFKASAVNRVLRGESVKAVAQDLGLVEQTLRNWVRAAAAGRLDAPRRDAMASARREIERLRAENLRLKRCHAFIDRAAGGLLPCLV